MSQGSKKLFHSGVCTGQFKMIPTFHGKETISVSVYLKDPEKCSDEVVRSSSGGGEVSASQILVVLGKSKSTKSLSSSQKTEERHLAAEGNVKLL